MAKQMSGKKEKRNEKNWDDICIRKNTINRLRLLKAQMQVPTYDDVIDAALNSLNNKGGKS